MRRNGKLIVAASDTFSTHKDRERKLSSLRDQVGDVEVLEIDRGSNIVYYQYTVSEFDGMKRIVY